MILGSRGQTLSKSCLMSTSRLTRCHKHVFLGLKTYFSQVLMAVKDCSAMGNHSKEGNRDNTKGTILHIYAHFDPPMVETWPPMMEIWPQGQNLILMGNWFLTSEVENRSCDLKVIIPRRSNLSHVQDFILGTLILLSIAKFTHKND